MTLFLDSAQLAVCCTKSFARNNDFNLAPLKDNGKENSISSTL